MMCLRYKPGASEEGTEKNARISQKETSKRRDKRTSKKRGRKKNKIRSRSETRGKKLSVTGDEKKGETERKEESSDRRLLAKVFWKGGRKRNRQRKKWGNIWTGVFKDEKGFPKGKRRQSVPQREGEMLGEGKPFCPTSDPNEQKGGTGRKKGKTEKRGGRGATMETKKTDVEKRTPGWED